MVPLRPDVCRERLCRVPATEADRPGGTSPTGVHPTPPETP
jgi:hypothetical protein